MGSLYSNIKMMHGPIRIKNLKYVWSFLEHKHRGNMKSEVRLQLSWTQERQYHATKLRQLFWQNWLRIKKIGPISSKMPLNTFHFTEIIPHNLFFSHSYRASWYYQSSDVLLTVHLSIFISVINQLDAQNFCLTISLFHVSTCFEHHVLIHQEVKIVLYSIWYHHTYRWPSRAQVERRPPIGVMIPEAV